MKRRISLPSKAPASTSSAQAPIATTTISAASTAEQRRGYLVLTDADGEIPFCLDHEDIVVVTFDLQNGLPFGITVVHRQHGKERETIVYEELHEVLEMARRAAEEDDDSF